MSWNNRVAWEEGMFLRAQHFQQQDRWTEEQIRQTLRFVRPDGWGFVHLQISQDLLTSGRFALTYASGVFDDGTPFSMPGEADLPPPLEIPDTTRDALIYLALPVRQAGAMEMIADGRKDGRYAVSTFEAFDTQSGSSQPSEIDIGRLSTILLTENSDHEGYLCLPVARVREVLPSQQVVLDQGWIPPSLTCYATTQLSALAIELTGMLNQRGNAIAARLTSPGGKGSAEVADFLLLQSINGWQNLMSHFAETGTVHPEDFYRFLICVAGELSTFTAPDKRPSQYQPYRHKDIQASFAPVVADIRRSLSAVYEQTAVMIELNLRRHGIRTGTIHDRSLLAKASFILAITAEMPTEELRRLFPHTVKIGAVEHIRELVNVAMPGIGLRPLPVAPRQMPFYAGATYFELDRNSHSWQSLNSSGGIALHVSGDFPGLKIELWAIRS